MYVSESEDKVAIRRRGRLVRRRKEDKQCIGQGASEKESRKKMCSRSKYYHRSECMLAKMRRNEQCVGEVGSEEESRQAM